jgi:DamX protein
VISAYERDGALQQNADGGAESAPLQLAAVEATEQAAVETPAEAPIEPQTELSMEPAAESTAELAVEQAVESIGAVQGEAWILARDPEHYTIQVIALKNRDNLLKLTDAHEGLQPMAVYRQGADTNPLYVLVQGDYADVESARAATSAFPRALAKPDQLWIRRFAMVQSLIDKEPVDARKE